MFGFYNFHLPNTPNMPNTIAEHTSGNRQKLDFLSAVHFTSVRVSLRLEPKHTELQMIGKKAY